MRIRVKWTLNRIQICIKWTPVEIGERFVFQLDENLNKMDTGKIWRAFLSFNRMRKLIKWTPVKIGESVVLQQDENLNKIRTGKIWRAFRPSKC
jgi:hypothetical protein